MFLNSKAFLKYSFYLFILLISFSSCERDSSINNTEVNMLPPAIPFSLQVASAHDGRIVIIWRPNLEKDIKGYNIYRSVNDSSSFRKISFTEDNVFLDDSLSYDSTYYYRVSAVDLQGRESSKAHWVSARPENVNPPQVPYGLEINARNWIDSLSVFLKWQPNSEGDIAGYNIYRSETPDFTPDKSNLAGFSSTTSFRDTRALKLYTPYYYRISAIDKGGMVSPTAEQVSDLILGIPDIVFPGNSSLVNYFDDFIIRTISVPARYRIIVQTNQYFGEIWNQDFYSAKTNDTVHVRFNASYIYTNSTYYWRVITFSGDNSEANSISQLHNFTIRP
ncbi:MAG: fibronectin type III domain-containing protein [Ignavibacteriales bacterium]